ncbi:uncharacterized protein LOC120428567 [Culex pipiens pallens]|uniref:uncharacterized protein LOC120428567 n=1 Tax=Culex pipiens pallens TaxID=42434 RepID=UPI001952ECD0|nr:uncharacterized protein LOC120428567 [Culex pipiens pallens]
MVPPASGVARGRSDLRSDERRTIAGHRRCSFRLGTRKRERHRFWESQADLLTCVPTDGDPSHDVADAASGSGPTNVNAYFVPCAKMVPPASGVARGRSDLRSDERRTIAGHCRCSFRLETRNVNAYFVPCAKMVPPALNEN